MRVTLNRKHKIEKYFVLYQIYMGQKENGIFYIVYWDLFSNVFRCFWILEMSTIIWAEDKRKHGSLTVYKQ